MYEPQRQHPVAALTKSLQIVRDNFITILIIVFIGGRGDEANFTLYWILGVVVFLLLWGVVSWFRFTFRVEEGELRIEQGIFTRQKLFLTSDRIQVIDISAGVVQRLFGLVAVEVKTAASSSKEARISALTRDKAEELKSLLRSRSKESVGDEERDYRDSDIQETRKKEVYTLTDKDLLIAASTSGRLGVALSILGGAFSQIDQLFSEQQIIEFAETYMPQMTSGSIIFTGIIIIVAVSWFLAFLGTIIKYFKFAVEVRDNELLISRGLFERTQLTIPFNRIQAVQIKEGLLRQPFGYASLIIESAGYGETQGNSTTLFPLIQKKRMNHFIESVIPEYATEKVPSPGELPRQALRRYLLKMIWISAAVITLLWMFFPVGIYSLFFVIPALFLGYHQYRDAGVVAEEDTFVLSYRLLGKTIAVVKKYRIQAIEVQQNPFQSKSDLGNLTVHVASGSQGRSFTVRELPENDALRYWQGVSARKSAYFLPDITKAEKEVNQRL